MKFSNKNKLVAILDWLHYNFIQEVRMRQVTYLIMELIAIVIVFFSIGK